MAAGSRKLSPAIEYRALTRNETSTRGASAAPSAGRGSSTHELIKVDYSETAGPEATLHT
jgi:hypothetical protein